MYVSFVYSFDPAEQFKEMRAFNISTHRSIHSRSFSPQKSNFRSIFSFTFYCPKIYYSRTVRFCWRNLPMDTPIQGLSATKKIKGIYIVKWHIQDSLGNPATIETCTYYITQADIRLFKPQEYFSENQAGFFLMNSEGTTWHLPVKYHFNLNIIRTTIFLWHLVKIEHLHVWHSMHLQAKMCPYPLWKGTTKISHYLRKN